MGNAFQTSSDLGVGLPPGSFVADDDERQAGVSRIARGNPNDEELAVVTAVLLGIRITLETHVREQAAPTAWGSASKAEHIRQSPLISAADPRLNAQSNRSWIARR